MEEIEKINDLIKQYYANVVIDFTLEDFYLINAKKEMPMLDGLYELQPVSFLLINLDENSNHSENIKLYIEKTLNDSFYIFGDNYFLPFNEEFKDIKMSNDLEEIYLYINTSCRKDT